MGNALSDVDGTLWYGEPIAWAAASSVVHGVSPTIFEPESDVTREQLATMLMNYARAIGKYAPANPTVLDSFKDRTSVSDWATEAVAWAAQNGIMGNGGYLSGQTSITRAETAAMLVNFNDLLTK